MMFSGLWLLVGLDIFELLLILSTIVTSTYSTTCSRVRIVASKVSLYSTCFTTFNWVKTVASKISLFYFANLYCLG